jgi:hypothetical protein
MCARSFSNQRFAGPPPPAIVDQVMGHLLLLQPRPLLLLLENVRQVAEAAWQLPYGMVIDPKGVKPVSIKCLAAAGGGGCLHCSASLHQETAHWQAALAALGVQRVQAAPSAEGEGGLAIAAGSCEGRCSQEWFQTPGSSGGLTWQ